MQTDELRAELAELAREVGEFSGDIGRVRRRVATRRIAMSSIAAVVVVVLVAGVVAIAHSRSNKLEVAGSAKDVKLSDLRRVDALVVLPPGSSGADAARVQTILDQAAVVERYALLPVAAVALVLRSDTDKSARALATEISANPPNRSYAVQLSRASDAAHQLDVALGANATVRTVPRSGIDVEVFMQVNASAAEVSTVRSRIEANPDVINSRFLTHQDAYNEFEKIFSDQPALVTSTTPQNLPESLQLQVRDDASPDAVARELRSLPGVDAAIEYPGQRYALPGITLEKVCAPSTP